MLSLGNICQCHYKIYSYLDIMQIWKLRHGYWYSLYSISICENTESQQNEACPHHHPKCYLIPWILIEASIRYEDCKSYFIIFDSFETCIFPLFFPSFLLSSCLIYMVLYIWNNVGNYTLRLKGTKYFSFCLIVYL